MALDSKGVPRRSVVDKPCAVKRANECICRDHTASPACQRAAACVDRIKTMNRKAAMAEADVQDAVFDSVAELFAVLSTPIRLKIISALCNGEKNVSQLLEEIDTTQPNMSQHLSTLYRAGVLGRRREGTQIRYRLESERVATLCRAVCTQVAIEMEGDAALQPRERLLPRR
jgi:ArsR family transcriptional regulator